MPVVMHMLPASLDQAAGAALLDPRATPRRPPRLVALGGGTGLPTVVEGLCGALGDISTTIWPDAITAIVTMTDDGGSSGQLRRTFGVLPPGDIRNCVLAGTVSDSPFRALLQHRFHGNEGLQGHPVGNLLLTVMSQMTGNFAEAVHVLGNLIGSRVRVLPASTDHATLRAEFQSGHVESGETAIAARGERIRRLSIEPSPRPLPDAVAALLMADAVVVGPGSLFTSVLPALLVQGVAPTISGINAVRIYVANLMTQPGETGGFTLDDHLQVIREHTGHDLFDYILVNRRPLNPDVVARYQEQGATPVEYRTPLEWAGRARVIEADFACETGPDQGKIRHEPTSLAEAVLRLAAAGRPQ